MREGKMSDDDLGAFRGMLIGAGVGLLLFWIPAIIWLVWL